MTWFSGYPIERERRDEIEATATTLPFRLDDFDAPEEIDPRGWLQIEDQGQVGSCQGHALSSCIEFAYRVDTGGDIVQLSRMWAYLQSQRFDGLLGRDAGSTLSAGLRVAKELGIPFEESFPYPGRYTTQIPPGLEEEAALFKIQSHVMCRSFDDIYTFLASGAGCVQIGCSWNQSMTPDRNGVIDGFQGGGGGGHSVIFGGYTRETGPDGRPFLWLGNSWSRQWGADGWAKVTARTADQIGRHSYSVMQGLSDMASDDIHPRSFDFISNNRF